MEANELLDQIRRKLEIPDGPRPGLATPASMAGEESWHRLRRAIRDLEHSAACVGEVPAGYPMHLNLIMRILHSLLPWYTRPIRQHAEHTVAVAKAMEAVLARMEAQSSAPANIDTPQ